MAACVTIENAIAERDTIAEEDRPGYDQFCEEYLHRDDIFSGFFYNRTHVWFKVHDADTRKVIAEKKFKGSGKAMQYLLQGPGVRAEDLSLDGPVCKHDPPCEDECNI